MNIAINAQRITREQKFGIDWFTLNLIENLKELETNHQFFVFVRAGGIHNLESSANLQIIELEGVNYAHWEQFVLPQACKKYNIDLLHNPANTGPIKYAGKQILTLHDVIFKENLLVGGGNYQKLGNLYRSFILEPLLRKVCRVVTISNSEKDVIAQRYPRLVSKLDFIHNGVDSKFHQEFNSARKTGVFQAYDLPSKFVLTIGSNDPRKNLEQLLEIWMEYEIEIPLVIINAPDWVESFSNDNIIPLNYVDSEDLPVIYQMASLFMYISKREGFGLPILEAMASKTPVCCLDFPVFREIADEVPYYLNPDFLAEQIWNYIKLLSQNKLEDTYRIELGSKIAHKFTWLKCAQFYLEQYNQCLIEE